MIYIDDQKVSIKEALRLLGVKEERIPAKTYKVFKIADKKKKPDRVNGGYLVPRSLTLKPYFTAPSPELGYNVEVRYVSQVVPKRDKDGDIQQEYFPHNMEFLGEAIAVDDSETFMWWFLNPNNRQSPFRAVNTGFYFEFEDREEMAEAEIEHTYYLTKALSLVMGDHALDVIRLKQLAKGMQVPNAEGMTYKLVQAALIRLIRQDPQKFYNKATSKTIQFEGVLQDAVDRGVLELRSLNGVKRWYLSGREILIVNDGKDHRQSLDEFIAENMEQYWPDILRGLEGVTTETQINMPDNAEFFKDFDAGSNSVKPVELGPEYKKEMREGSREFKEDMEMERLLKVDPADPTVHKQTILKRERLAKELEEYQRRKEEATKPT
jgi:hypothetical protein